MASKPGRKYILWCRNPTLRVIKQLAGVLKEQEALNQFTLWGRVETLLPMVLKEVLGIDKTFKEIREEVKNKQGEERKITPNRLWGRADVVTREGYKEVDEFTPAVREAYFKLTKVRIDLDPKRVFSEDDMRIMVIRQKKQCYNPTCKAPFTGLNPPIGAHANVPYSLGGKTNTDNGVALCWSCNSRQGIMPLAEFIAKCAMNNAGARRKLGKECEGVANGTHN